MSLNIQSPTGGPDVTRANKRSILYVTTDPTAVIGDETNIDGSIRFVFTPGDTEAHIEAKADGVWNDTSLRVAASSLMLGRDLL